MNNWLSITLLIVMLSSHTMAVDYIFETADEGQLGRFGGSGIGASDNFFTGAIFELTEPAEVGQIGGLFSGSGTIFGAVVDVSGPRVLPNPVDLSGDDVLGTAVLTMPDFEDGVQDVSAPLDLSLAPGWYSLVFGSGKFGASGNGRASGDNPNPNPAVDIFTSRQSDLLSVFQISEPRFYLAGAPQATVPVTIEAAVDAEANCLPGDFGCSFDDDDLGISVQRLDDFNNKRGVIEFDLSNIPPDTQIDSASLNLQLSGFTVGAGLNLFGYAGTGSLDDVDAATPGQLIGTTGEIEDFDVTIDLDEEYIQGLLGEASHFGMLALPTDGPRGVNFRTIEAHALLAEAFMAPTLVLDIVSSGMRGDFDGSGSYEAADIDLLCASLNTEELRFDLNSDGQITTADLDALLSEMAIIRGDADFDRTVGFSDFLLLSAGFNKDGNWANGDFDCSGQVGFADFLELSKNFGETSAAASVPEPNGFHLLAIAFLLALATRDRAGQGV